MFESKYSRTQKLTLTAILIALSVVFNFFRISVPVGGIPLLRFSIGSPFLNIIPIMFGPLFGGIAAAIADIVTFLLNPQQTFLWQLTVTSFLKGALIGIIWKYAKNLNINVFSKILLGLFVLAGVIGVINTVSFLFFADSFYAVLYDSLGETQWLASYGFIAVCAVGLGVYLYSKKIVKEEVLRAHFIKIIVSVGIAGFIFSMANSVILQQAFPVAKDLFSIVFVLRLIVELIMIIYNTYIIMALGKMIPFFRRSQ